MSINFFNAISAKGDKGGYSCRLKDLILLQLIVNYIIDKKI